MNDTLNDKAVGTRNPNPKSKLVLNTTRFRRLGMFSYDSVKKKGQIQSFAMQKPRPKRG